MKKYILLLFFLFITACASTNTNSDYTALTEKIHYAFDFNPKFRNYAFRKHYIISNNEEYINNEHLLSISLSGLSKGDTFKIYQSDFKNNDTLVKKYIINEDIDKYDKKKINYYYLKNDKKIVIYQLNHGEKAYFRLSTKSMFYDIQFNQSENILHIINTNLDPQFIQEEK